MISRNKFEKIKEKYGEVASFAIWVKPHDKPKSNIGDMSVFDLQQNPRLLETLNANVVMVGLNFAREKGEHTLSEKFKNFHDPNPRGQDYKIRYAFEGSPYYGAYMTDIIKNFVMLDSGDVKKYIKNNKEYLLENVRKFEREIVDIGAVKPIILAFGADTYKILNDNLLSEFYSKIIKLPHYSHHIGKEEYRQKVHAELGL